MNRMTEPPVHVIRLDAHNEHYVVMYDERHRSKVLLRLAQWASNTELAFTWYDAARLSQEVRNW